MRRGRAIAACALLSTATLVGCAQDLSCSGGAVEINGVCECPEGSRYVRDSGACAPVDGLVGDAGARDAASPEDAGATPDASDTPDASTPDASTPVDSRARDAGDASTLPDAAVAPPPSCAADLLLCSGECIDPRTDEKHCGGCAPCSRPGLTCRDGECVDVGCSDGTREAFTDEKQFPSIAGCAATWPAASMLAARQLERCGNSAGKCKVPADACAARWHVCGSTAEGAADLSARVGQKDCSSQIGSFAAALGDQQCRPCTDQNSLGAVCCGTKCVDQKGSCLWPGATAWFGVRNGVSQVCGRIENPTVSIELGVLCCRDER